MVWSSRSSARLRCSSVVGLAWPAVNHRPSSEVAEAEADHVAPRDGFLTPTPTPTPSLGCRPARAWRGPYHDCGLREYFFLQLILESLTAHLSFTSNGF